MRFARFRYNDKAEMKGIVEDDRIVRIYGGIFNGCSVTDETYPLNVEYLPPVLPMTIVCISNDCSYIKSISSVIGSGNEVKLIRGKQTRCIKRLAYVMKDHRGNIFGTTEMLDIVYPPNFGDINSSSAGHTVLGRYIDEKFADNDLVKSVIERITLNAGDIIAVETGIVDCAIGDTLEYGSAKVKLI